MTAGSSPGSRARGVLNAPWGLAQAPRSFGRFGGDLLIGNFGDGRINAFRRTSGGWSYAGTLNDGHGKPLVVNGLWGLGFGNDGTAGPRRHAVLHVRTA